MPVRATYRVTPENLLAPRTGPKTMLQWIAPTLVKMGVLQNNNWVEDNCAAAERMFPRATQCAVTMTACAPQALEFLTQCPMLVPYFFVKAQFDDNPYRTGLNIIQTAGTWTTILRANRKLRDIMRAARMPKPLRQIVPQVIREESPEGFLRNLSLMNPSTLAQCIPEQPLNQGPWMEMISDWAEVEPNVFEWICRYALDPTVQANHADMLDYIEQNAIDTLHCTPRVLAERSNTWHRGFYHIGDVQLDPNNFRIDFNADGGVLLDYKTSRDFEVEDSPYPMTLEIGSYVFHQLNTSKKLEAEGKAMGHCVGDGGYHEKVKRKSSFIYSIQTPEGIRVATAEFIKGSYNHWDSVPRRLLVCRQVQGVRRTRAAPSVLTAIEMFIHEVS